MKKLALFLIILLSISSFGLSLGFSTNEGIWFSESIENLSFRLGYPYSKLEFQLPTDLLTFGVSGGYLFNNSNFLLQGYFETFVDKFGFGAYIKSTYHKVSFTDESTETGRIYFGMTPSYFLAENLKVDFNFEFSGVYLYYDPNLDISFPSIINSEDILRYSIGIDFSYFLDSIKFFLGFRIKYKWVDYLTIPIFNNDFINFGIEVSANDN